MAIDRNFVDGIEVRRLKHSGVAQMPTLIVMHYSVTNTVSQAVSALNAANLSYHILIEKNGRAIQTRPFTQSAAHPGLSNWKPAGGVSLGSSVSRGSIGICLMNKGFAYDQSSPSAAGKLIYNPADPSMQRWETYPAAQVQAARAIVADIVSAYSIQEIVGHHDIAIMGKFDPGPLFDLGALNALLPTRPQLGFRTRVKSKDGILNVRQLPRANAPLVAKLDNGHVVHIRSIAYGKRSDCIHPSPGTRARYLTRWASVDIDGSNRHSGFVHMGSLEHTPLEPRLAAFL